MPFLSKQLLFSLLLHPISTLSNCVFSASSTSSSPNVSASYNLHNATCTSYTIPLTLNGSSLIFNPALRWTDNFELAEFSTALTATHATPPTLFTGEETFAGSFEVGATFCGPLKGKKKKTVIVASHGLGFDRSYWAIPFDAPEYNFAQYMLDEGYAVFFYDRLGVGSSSRISGFVNQFSPQLQALAHILSSLRAGKYTGSFGIPTALVVAGHSFGSTLSHGIASTAPDLVDAVVLTGYLPSAELLDVVSILGNWQPRIFASTEKGLKGYDAGYVTWVELYSNVETFFVKGGYERAAAEYSEAHKSPFGIAEGLTGTPALFANDTSFSKPVLVVTGAEDWLFCAGNCTDVLKPASQKAFPNSKALQTHLQPTTGHGMNLHRNATGYFGVVADFLKKNGL